MTVSASGTRVWEVAERHGFKSLRQLARAMGVSPQLLSAVRGGKKNIGMVFVEGARRAFPDYPLDYLFPAPPAPPVTAPKPVTAHVA